MAAQPKPAKAPFFRFGPAPTYVTFVQARGRRYMYNPQKDITTWELAMLTPLLIGIAAQREEVDVDEYLERHGLMRHFTVQM